MPTYEYLCEKCEHEFEREQRITDPPVKTCPKCKARRVKKLISRTSFVLKGGGWYNDLYSSAKDTKSDSGSESKSESTSESSSPPAKKESKSESQGSSKGKGKGKSSKSSGKSAA